MVRHLLPWIIDWAFSEDDAQWIRDIDVVKHLNEEEGDVLSAAIDFALIFFDQGT
jgi:hypothetical protein